MTVEEALRECEEAICNCDALEKAAHGHLPRCAERLRVLARYGDLREKEGREASQVGLCPHGFLKCFYCWRDAGFPGEMNR